VPRDRIVGALRHFAGVKFEPSVANAAFDQLRPSVAESLCASAEKFMLIRCCLPKKVCRPRGWSSKPSDGRRFVCGHSLSGSGALSKGRAMKPSAHWAMPTPHWARSSLSRAPATLLSAQLRFSWCAATSRPRTQRSSQRSGRGRADDTARRNRIFRESRRSL
jgi:hypothetical protein